MPGKDVGYHFLDALAKSIGMAAESVKYAPNRETAPLGAVTRTNAAIYSAGNLADITAYAQISGNAVAVCWDNPLGKGMDRAEVSIPDAYKFETFNDYDTYTNSGIKVKVSYGADNVLKVEMPITHTAFDSILILMAPKNV